MSACPWQQILALDARYNTHRAPNDPTFRSLYIRRRSQLLREYAASKTSNDSLFQKDYLPNRAHLLSERYGFVPSEGSLRSRSLSVRSGSQVTLEGDEVTRKAVPFSYSKPKVSSVDAQHRQSFYEFKSDPGRYQCHKDSITRIKFAHDEQRRVAIASTDATISIYNISKENDTTNSTLTLVGHKKGVIDIAWSVSNDFLLSCSLDSTLRLWDPDSGQCLRIIEDSSPVLCCIFQPVNNNLVVTGNIKGLVQVLNISTGKYVKTGTCKTAGSAVCMCCDHAGRLLWVGDEKGTLSSFLMDPTLGKLVKGRRIFISTNCPITSLSSRPWGNSSSNKQTLVLINSASNALYVYCVIGTDGSLQPVRKIPLYHRRLTIHSTFCPLVSFKHGSFVVSGSEDGCVHLFDIGTSDRSSDLKLKGHECPVIDVSFNHDETYLVSGDSKGVVLIWKRIKNENFD